MNNKILAIALIIISFLLLMSVFFNFILVEQVSYLSKKLNQACLYLLLNNYDVYNIICKN